MLTVQTDIQKYLNVIMPCVLYLNQFIIVLLSNYLFIWYYTNYSTFLSLLTTKTIRRSCTKQRLSRFNNLGNEKQIVYAVFWSITCVWQRLEKESRIYIEKEGVINMKSKFKSYNSINKSSRASKQNTWISDLNFVINILFTLTFGH